MTDEIFVIHPDGSLVGLSQKPYDSEALLQALLARYPDLLVGGQIDPNQPRRWLFVAREAGVPGALGSADRWAVDHLFLDQDGIPTLVEVKRSTDTRIRREVIGQMLDYAANAVVYWPVETIQARYEARCAADGLDSVATLDAFLGPEGRVDAFWEQVKTNLQAGRLRLLLVADKIPAELRRVVEFLNGQMNPAEVLALEVPQFVGGSLQTLAPRVIGRTEQSRSVKSAGARPSRQWDEASFFSTLAAKAGVPGATAARRILDWAQRRPLEVWWGRGLQDGSYNLGALRGREAHWILSCWTYGRVEVTFQYLKERAPFSSVELRQELRRRLNEIAGVAIDEAAIEVRPRIELTTLAPEPSLARFLEVMDWVCRQVSESI